MTLTDVQSNIIAIKNTLGLIEYKGETNNAYMYGVFGMLDKIIKDISLMNKQETRTTNDGGDENGE